MTQPLLVGGLLGLAYSLLLQRTSFRESDRSIDKALRWALATFLLRLSTIGLVFYGLARFSSLNLSWVVVAFIGVITLYLFLVALKAYFIDVKRRGSRLVGRV